MKRIDDIELAHDIANQLNNAIDEVRALKKYISCLLTGSNLKFINEKLDKIESILKGDVKEYEK